MLAKAVHDRQRVVPAGNGTRLRASTNPPSDAVTLSSLALTSGFAHYAGDLVATIPAGVALREANDALAASGQWLPLDPLTGQDTTIGGLVASNDSGPRRHRFGSPRDLIIGIEVALTSGRVIRAGGRVVKNVAGYDLARLFCGSRGSLGVITSATFKLSPLPHASRTLVVPFSSASDAADAALRLAASPLTPSVVEVVSPEPRLLVRFESTASAASSMATAAASLSGAGTSRILHGDEETQMWSAYYELKAAAECVVKASVLPTEVPAMLGTVESSCAFSARPAVGIIDLFPETANEIARIDALVREHGGHLIVMRGLDEPVVPALARSNATAVMDAVKRQFDPAGILPNPWSAL
jgi:glycolate oxidase FAD binding subunit